MDTFLRVGHKLLVAPKQTLFHAPLSYHQKCSTLDC